MNSLLHGIALAALGIGALAAASVLLAGLWKGLYRRERNCDETHFVTTPDGWRLALHRYVPKEPRVDGARVLLVHGLGGNSMNWDLSERQSLPLFLAAAGYEAWTLDLRGAGLSSKPRWRSRFRFDYDFDDHLRRDLPTAIAYLAARGDGPVHYVGHSMGAMLGYAVLAESAGKALRSAVLLAGPGRLEHYYYPAAGRFEWLMRRIPSFLFGTGTKVAAPLFDRFPSLPRRIGLKADNLYPGDASAAAANNQDNVSMRIMLQFGRWAEMDAKGLGEPEFRAGLPGVTTPALFVAGGDDLIAPVASVRHAFDLLGSPDKRFVVLSREAGYRHDYEHGDIQMGRWAREEVFPLLVDWLARH
jgi:pimeloyl-ACP methyl ester carboxylesterase